MALYLTTPDVKLLIDAGASLGPRSHRIPHPLEYKALKETRSKLERFAKKSDIITISHYHFDHYTAAWTNLDYKWTWSSYDVAKKIYSKKIILAKDYLDSINPSQRKRGWIFNKVSSEFVKEIKYIDSKELRFKRTKIRFSKPFPHGTSEANLGFVLCLEVEYDGDKFLFCPDLQGPIEDKVLNYILKKNPNLVVIGGPPIYLSGFKINPKSIQKGLQNLVKIVSTVPVTLIDHHMLRDETALINLQSIRKKADLFHNRVYTYAEYLGKKNRLLEANRSKLYENFPPDQDFKKWTKLSLDRQRFEPPPI